MVRDPFYVISSNCSAGFKRVSIIFDNYIIAVDVRQPGRADSGSGERAGGLNYKQVRIAGTRRCGSASTNLYVVTNLRSRGGRGGAAVVATTTIVLAKPTPNRDPT